MAFARSALSLVFLMLLSASGALGITVVPGVCKPSTLSKDFKKMVQLRPNVFFHWKIVGANLVGAIEAKAASKVNTGWISLGFSKAGKMTGSDAIVGNAGGGVQAYLMSSISKSAIKPSPNFKITAATVTATAASTIVKFTRTAKGNVALNLAGKNILLWATSKGGNSKVFNDHTPTNRGAVSINFGTCK
ncbi:hypothetical protein CLOM_g13886 [Closterium sp. NIES-68]|nr:hypothetical protein CLOM_g18798 [Closterium sp. NIES-68]GJP54863.1 hypothetical protein CLOM_g13886 [Closterium sp. NIES-68]GJP67032.1 hypothetical protein CLOP_g23908 [Closterium sp. NIES-67]GJP71005.1 hypothetical protein CLOP_g1890 [Closterium sp. NIES-67]